MDEVQLMNLFGQFGPIEKVKIIYDKVTGESRGYGFVLFQFFFSATYAISYLNRSTIAGKKLKVGYASVTAAKEAYEAMKGSATAFSAPQQQTLEYMYRSQAAQTGGEQYGASYNQPAYGGSAYAYTQ
ncbi:RNA-binding protein [Angomonas deanei]|nr:RNA-binding protein [Angomonas deanei]|eukprot:EPY24053.1 RNA-binding protein [Angomonas deanei]